MTQSNRLGYLRQSKEASFDSAKELGTLWCSIAITPNIDMWRQTSQPTGTKF